jgi:hypothetical protein
VLAFHHLVQFFPNAFSANLLRQRVLDVRVTRGILQLGHHRESEAAGEADAADDSQRVVRKRLLRRQRRPDCARTKVIESLRVRSDATR